MPESTRSSVRPLLDAAEFAGEVISLDPVRAKWSEPSALERMSVGAVVGHLFLIVRRIEKHLSVEDEPTDSPLMDYRWLRIEHTDDLDNEAAKTVRDDGQHVADWGSGAVITAYHDRLERLRLRLDHPLPARIRLESGAMATEAYLRTRIIELLVHADDLAASIELPTPDPPGASVTVAIETLVDAARSIYGDLDVMRAFTRAERIPPTVPSVY
jgi:hypothetical protein